MTTEDAGRTGAADLPDVIAVTGLACRFPGAPDIAHFWANLVAGRDSITFRTSEELAALGVPATRLADPRFVPAGGVVEGIDEFDAEFFGITPRDAELMDPQHRLFLQCAVAALEDAGQATRGVDGGIAVYSSAGFNSYLTHRLLPHAAELADRADMQWLAAGDKDYLATQTSYRLGLTGPSLSVQAACSSALVAVHLAVEALLSGECDVALVGAASVGVAQGLGYRYTEGGILSADGRCRPFDAGATGTVFGSGVGAVVLKRLADAVTDGDGVRAVLLGSAVNNDGDRKVGFTAPSLDGQVRVIRTAQSVAGVGPEDIACLEAHGTGTALGDRIELAALRRVFADAPNPHRVLGAVKSNVGHLDTCAGMAGFIKTVLALHHRTLLPTVHFESPADGLDPQRFRVLTAAEPWPGADGTRTAGVSSFGIGGTNAHVVLQDAPATTRRTRCATDEGWQLLPLSGRSPDAVDRAAERLESALAEPDGPDVADAAHTLQTGRTAHPWRRAVTVQAGRRPAPPGPGSAVRVGQTRPVVALVYPGQGAGSPGMAAGIHRDEPAFRHALDRALEALRPWTAAPLRDLLLDPAPSTAFERTDVAAPALFAVEYALTEWWRALGVRPVAVAGHSVGEFAAACAADVLTLGDAARLVARRGELMGRMRPGAMLAVSLPEHEVHDVLEDLRSRSADGAEAVPEISAVNAPDRCVLSGEPAVVERLRDLLAARGVAARPLPVRHAFHSRHADPLLDEFADLVATVPMRAPAITVVSALTGRPLTAELATSPRYWSRQLRETVRFANALRALPDGAVVVEAGPGRTVTGFARRTLGPERLVLPTLDEPRDGDRRAPARLTAVARLWERGAAVDWTGLGERRGLRKVSLPTYPFERARHWFTPASEGFAGTSTGTRGDPVGGVEAWFSVPSWSASAPPRGALPRTVLLLADATGLADGIAARLVDGGARVHLVRRAASRLPDGIRALPDHHLLDPDVPEAFDALVAELDRVRSAPDAVVCCWAVDDVPLQRATVDDIAGGALLGLTVPSALARSLSDRFPGRPVRMLLLTDAAQAAGGGRPRTPHAAVALGAVRALPSELPGSVVRALDLDCAPHGPGDIARAADAAVAELAALDGAGEPLVAVRGRLRLVPDLVRPALGDAPDPTAGLPGGTWLITGGLGGIGAAVAGRLARDGDRTVVLLTRRPVPDGPAWQVVRPEGASPGPCPPDLGRTLTGLAAHGADICVVQCDVVDERGLTEALDTVRERYGRIRGVVHAAGLPGGGTLARRRHEDIARVLDPKVRGTVLLHRLTERDRPVLVLCSSVLATVGAAGQGDYAGANAFLDSFAHTTDTAVSIAWDRWSETGMAVRPGAVDWPEGAGERLTHPLFAARRDGPDGWTEFLLRHGPHTRWLAREHRMGDEPVLPGTALLDLAVAAHGELTGPRRAVDDPRPAAGTELDAVFTSPVRVPDEDATVVAVRLRPRPGGDHDWEVRSSGSVARPHAHGRIGSHRGGPPRRLDAAALHARLAEAGPRVPRAGGALVTGPRWDCVTHVHVGQGELLLALSLSEEHRDDVAAHPLHPALLDVATGALVEGSVRYLPVAYRTLVVHDRLGADAYAHVVLRSGDPLSGGTVVADVTLTDPDGRSTVVVEGFVLRPVPSPPAPGAVPRGIPATGIPTGAGLAALERILAHPHLPHVLVSPRAEAATDTTPAASDPPLRSAEAASPDDSGPDGSVGRVAGIWTRLLGTTVGSDDSVFELGADSLTIVQIATEMQRAGLSVTPGDIFAHPTPRAVAALLAERDAASTSPGDPPEDGRDRGADDPAGDGLPPTEPVTEEPGRFPAADLGADELARVLHLFRSGEDTPQ